ncbi:MAG: hypothetical protein N2556_02565 [Anaerolineae bacterium]|nr:hypothetical protein [Anaerolineae bacterium]
MKAAPAPLPPGILPDLLHQTAFNLCAALAASWDGPVILRSGNPFYAAGLALRLETFPQAGRSTRRPMLVWADPRLADLPEVADLLDAFPPPSAVLLLFARRRRRAGEPGTWDVAQDLSCVAQDSSCVVQDSSCAAQDLSCVAQDSSCAPRDLSCAARDSSCAARDLSCVAQDLSCAAARDSSYAPRTLRTEISQHALWPREVLGWLAARGFREEVRYGIGGPDYRFWSRLAYLAERLGQEDRADRFRARARAALLVWGKKIPAAILTLILTVRRNG